MVAQTRPTALPARVANAAAKGWSIIPQMWDKKACFRWKEFQERRPTPKELERWSRDYPHCLWAIVTGQLSGIIVLDFDVKDEGLDTLDGLDLRPAIRTPSGGAHVYVRAPDQRLAGGARISPEFPGMDLRADGQLATFYGNNLLGRYEVMAGRKIYSAGNLPEPLQELLRLRVKTVSATRVEIPDGFTGYLSDTLLLIEALDKVDDSGGRNEAGFWLACQLRDERFTFEDAVVVMEQYADAASARTGDSPYTYQEAYNSTVSAWTSEPRTPRNLLPTRFANTDFGNAERLVARHGSNIRYCPQREAWLIWNGTIWAPDQTLEIDRLAKETVRRTAADAMSLDDPKAREAVRKHALRSESSGKLRAMVNIAQSERAILVAPEHLDRDAWLLTTNNVTVDLRTGETFAPRKTDLITKRLPYDYDADADCPIWRQFLEEVLPQMAVRRFVQRAIGYSLTGDIREHVAFFLHGTGSNGKTTLLETLRAMLGDHSHEAHGDMFLRSRGSQTNDIAGIAGYRFVTVGEFRQGSKIDERLLKKLTGGDSARARLLYKEFFEFTPLAKFWLAMNHKPDTDDYTEGLWRRIRLIPFEQQFTEDRKDTTLPAKLRAELPGILNWAIAGCRRWLSAGTLAAPHQVLAATERYRKEQDAFGAFLEDSCVIGPDRWAYGEDLYRRYEVWCSATHERQLTERMFLLRLSERRELQLQRIRKGPKGNQRRAWKGIGLP